MLEEAMAVAADWADELADAGGPDVRIKAHLKAAHEARELADDPSNLEEFADVLICLAVTARRQGFSAGDLAMAVLAKTRVNAARTWSQKPDGTWQHDA